MYYVTWQGAHSIMTFTAAVGVFIYLKSDLLLFSTKRSKKITSQTQNGHIPLFFKSFTAICKNGRAISNFCVCALFTLFRNFRSWYDTSSWQDNWALRWVAIVVGRRLFRLYHTVHNGAHSRLGEPIYVLHDDNASESFILGLQMLQVELLLIFAMTGIVLRRADNDRPRAME